MLEMEAIEESTSPWSSPIVMVPKPDSKLHLYNDFRKLNEVADFDSYPMLWVAEHIKRLRRACIISTLDLIKGYWQEPLALFTCAKTNLWLTQYGNQTMTVPGPPLWTTWSISDFPMTDECHTLSLPNLYCCLP